MSAAFWVNSLARESCRVAPPQREHASEPRVGELGFSVGADVGEEEIPEDDVRDTVGGRGCEGVRHCLLVHLVWAGIRDLHPGERQADRGRLCLEQGLPNAMHGHPLEGPRHRREEAHDLDVAGPAHFVQRVGCILAAAPRDERARSVAGMRQWRGQARRRPGDDGLFRAHPPPPARRAATFVALLKGAEDQDASASAATGRRGSRFGPRAGSRPPRTCSRSPYTRRSRRGACLPDLSGTPPGRSRRALVRSRSPPPGAPSQCLAAGTPAGRRSRRSTTPAARRSSGWSDSARAAASSRAARSRTTRRTGRQGMPRHPGRAPWRTVRAAPRSAGTCLSG